MDGLTGNGSLPADAEVGGGHGATMRAVPAAQKARAEGEPGAEYALRQSLVDLSAVAELLADDLPRPRFIPREARERGR